jgi:hypothetical protein
MDMAFFEPIRIFFGSWIGFMELIVFFGVHREWITSFHQSVDQLLHFLNDNYLLALQFY